MKRGFIVGIIRNGSHIIVIASESTTEVRASSGDGLAGVAQMSTAETMFDLAGFGEVSRSSKLVRIQHSLDKANSQYSGVLRLVNSHILLCGFFGGVSRGFTWLPQSVMSPCLPS